MKTTRKLESSGHCGGLGVRVFVLSLLFAGWIAPASAQSSPPPARRIHVDLEGFDLSGAGSVPNQVTGGSREIPIPSASPAAVSRPAPGAAAPQAPPAPAAPMKAAPRLPPDVAAELTPSLYAPRLGKSFSTHPVFHWRIRTGGSSAFRLTTLDGRTLYTADVTGQDHIEYPESAPGLVPGVTYLWSVTMPQAGVTASAQILMLGEPERSRIAAQLQSAADPAAAAQVMVDHRVWYDAIERYSRLLAQRPDDRKARTVRAEMYDQLPVTKILADADWSLIR